ncbi:MAG: isoprenylcysteine carboxylmethyltransferase family protein [Acidobacteriota bacterium]|jgi:Putative protein-S-isoprenylcysteine methyltransferase|nr:isoprenylcysteine carboxylmethyltransferase family protein [Acidobacteriota bacterium]
MKLKTLVGSGDKIARSVLPVIIIGLALNVWRPSIFSVGGPSPVLKIVSIALLVPGVVVWARSVALILRKVPRKELITTGPYAIVKHPLYTGAAFFVLPWLGFLFNSWLGVAAGIALYAGSRVFSPREEDDLAKTFGPAWEEYRRNIKLPWL